MSFVSVLKKSVELISVGRNMSNLTGYTFSTLKVTAPKDFVYHVELNRPDKLNAMNRAMWKEIGDCFDTISDDSNCRVVVLSGAGPKLFTAGIDFKDMVVLGSDLGEHEDIARKSRVLMKTIVKYQNSITSIEKCKKPVIAAVHGPCVGGGLNIITAADIRYCTADAWFQNKEVDIGLTADVGTNQRMQKIIGSISLNNELAFTCRKLPADEAKDCGLVSKIFSSKESLIEGAIETAAIIASKSPVAVQGTKQSIVYSRDHTVQEGLDHVAMYNQAMIQSEDFINAVTAQATKGDPPVFSKL